MGKHILSIIISFIMFCSFGQISLEHTFSLGLKHAQLSNQVVYYGNIDSVLYIYNENYTLYKEVYLSSVVPKIIKGSGTVYDYLEIELSDKKFNNDELIELVVSIYSETSNPKFYLFNENHQKLIDFDTLTPKVSESGSNFSLDYIESISQPKKMIIKYMPEGGVPGNGEQITKVYILNNTITNSSEAKSQSVKMLKAFPNPNSTSEITISYELPASSSFGEMKIYDSKGIEVDSFKIGKHFNSIKVNTSTYTNGTYVCKVYANGTLTSTEKLIIQK